MAFHFTVKEICSCSFIYVFQMFEGNVIPDAGNEIVVNFFERPITTSYIIIYEFYNNAHHLSPTIRFDFIGC